jgi:glycosyltransferase involved in cell wall biosynthesis
VNSNLLGVTISAVIPVRNGEEYIESSFEQVTANLQQNDEAIYVVNGSSDGTLEKITRLADSDKRIRVINLGDTGLISALNLGISEALNPWIARFDVDDLYLPDRLQKQRVLISRETVAIFSDYSVVGKDLRELGMIPSGVNNLPTMVSLYGANRTPHPSALFSKEAFIEAGMYKLEDFAAEDLGLWLRMTRTGEFRSIPLPLLKYRLHGNSTVAANREIALTNTKRLLTDTGVPRQILDEAFLKANEVVLDYESVAFEEERSVLFLLNLHQATKYMSYSMKEKGSFRRYALCRLARPKSIEAISKLEMDLRKRRAYRSTLSNTE